MILRYLWEWQPPLLPNQAAVTQLTCVLNVRQPPDHLLHLVEGMEAKMAIAGMPQPWPLYARCSQTDGLLLTSSRAGTASSRTSSPWQEVAALGPWS